jgi:uncharacterized membrane protein
MAAFLKIYGIAFVVFTVIDLVWGSTLGGLVSLITYLIVSKI